MSGQRYRRNLSGKVVHRADCRTLSPQQGMPWVYADDMTPPQVGQVIRNHPWLRACRICRPDQVTP